MATYTANEHWLAIDYKLHHTEKIYNAAPFVVDATKGGHGTPATSAPFDTELIAPGKSWTLPARAKFIRKRELSGVVTAQGGTPD